MIANQHEPESEDASFTVGEWDDSGHATVEASGADIRSAIEGALRAVLALTDGQRGAPSPTSRAAPLRGEGRDLATLLAAMIGDLLAQIEIYGAASDVVIDGVLHRDGGYISWGYVRGHLNGVPLETLPVLAAHPSVAEDESGSIVLSARLGLDASAR